MMSPSVLRTAHSVRDALAGVNTALDAFKQLIEGKTLPGLCFQRTSLRSLVFSLEL